MFQNVIPWKFWNNIPLGGKYKDNNENSARRDLNSRSPGLQDQCSKPLSYEGMQDKIIVNYKL